METNFKNLTQLYDFFKDEEACVAYLEAKRWGENAICPHCGGAKAYRTNRGFKCADKDCAKKFTVKVGTIFESSKIGLRTWFAAIYLCTAHKKGIASHQLARDLGVTQKTAWFLLHRVREMLKDKAPEMLTGTVEVDETYVGGKERNKHNSKRNKQTGMVDKAPMLGFLKRGGNVVLKTIEVSNGATIKPIVRNMVGRESVLITDGFGAYNGLNKEYAQHEIVNHTNDEYVRGIYHTNTIEGFWSLLKRGIVGIYHSVSPKHLHRYCDEFSYRYNSRDIRDNERFSVSIGNVEGRLTYKQLIK